MGSKTSDEYQQTPNASDSIELKPANQNLKPSQRASTLADLDRGIIGDDDDDDDSNAADEGPGVNMLLSNEKKKKKKLTELGQITPSRVLVSSLFPFVFLEGELTPYENTSRVTDEESRFDSRLWGKGFLDDYREAAEIHRQVRQYAQKELIKPGASLLSIADGIEDGIRALSGHQGLETGDSLEASMGFPTGLCLNNIAAHWTPNPGGKDVILQNSDVLKVDFGVQKNGRIVDSAFTITFDHTYDNLLTAVKEATNTGILHAGVDARMSDIGAAIQEVTESYEIEIGGKVLPVKTIRNITGHDILRYHIHGGKQVPFVRNKNRDKMEEDEVFAIETFGSTGTGYLRDDVCIVFRSHLQCLGDMF
ncbi:hypothetical protein OCU04_006674 [Sclerotinia nivalis]|uniref:Peptidase M24 domain-containing protein n=1 Tax=Sclerotinia nivalis TaxID=352851 RepID=A0A9X0AL61_9HELO|nr:hypothetical protein OCU04_006674 [Sclerotinia nivalis]